MAEREAARNEILARQQAKSTVSFEEDIDYIKAHDV